MPYVAIKAFPKEEESTKEVVRRINEVLIDVWKCNTEAIAISMEEVEPENWMKVEKEEIEPKMDRMMIYAGKENF